MTSSTRIRARSFGSRPLRIRLLITLSEIEPTGWPLCMTGIWENFQCCISPTAVCRGSLASRYWTFRVWILSTSAFFSCFFSSAWREFMIRRTTSYEGFIFLPEFSSPSDITSTSNVREPVRAAWLGPPDRKGATKDIYGPGHPRRTAPGALRGTQHLRRGTHPHADRATGHGDRREEGHRPPGQHRRWTRGSGVAGAVQDVRRAVRADPASQHGPGRGRRRAELAEVRRGRVPRARVHPPGGPRDDGRQRRAPPLPHDRDRSRTRLPHADVHEPQRRCGRHLGLQDRPGLRRPPWVVRHAEAARERHVVRRRLRAVLRT